MDIKSLRIDDIVTTDGTPANTKKGEYYEVVNIISDEWWNDEKENVKHIGCVSIKPITDRNEYVGGAWVDYLQPIPITDKLLMDAGFKFRPYKPLRDALFYAKDIEIMYSITEKDGYRFISKNTNKDIKYLHELQHEMLDSGHDFKIKI